MKDPLNKALEMTVRKLLREARAEPFEQKLNAVKVAIIWFTQSRKLNPQDDQGGALLEEMRKAIGDGEPSASGGAGGSGGAGPSGSTVVPKPGTAWSPIAVSYPNAED